MQLFYNEIIPRKLTIEQQDQLAIQYAKYELVELLVADEILFKNKYNYAVYIGAEEEAENMKIMLSIIDKALKFSLN